MPRINYDSKQYLGEATPGGEYQVGMYQPAIVVLNRRYECVFHWVAAPGPANIGGACIVRPSASRVLRAAQGLAVAGSALSGKSYRELWQAPLLPLLLPLLLANGNFVRPRTLTNDASGNPRLRTLLAPIKLAGALAVVATAARYSALATLAGVIAYATYIKYAFGEWFRKALWQPECR